MEHPRVAIFLFKSDSPNPLSVFPGLASWIKPQELKSFSPSLPLGEPKLRYSYALDHPATWSLFWHTRSLPPSLHPQPRVRAFRKGHGWELSATHCDGHGFHSVAKWALLLGHWQFDCMNIPDPREAGLRPALYFRLTKQSKLGNALHCLWLLEAKVKSDVAFERKLPMWVDLTVYMSSRS